MTYVNFISYEHVQIHLYMRTHIHPSISMVRMQYIKMCIHFFFFSFSFFAHIHHPCMHMIHEQYMHTFVFVFALFFHAYIHLCKRHTCNTYKHTHTNIKTHSFHIFTTAHGTYLIWMCVCRCMDILACINIRTCHIYICMSHTYILGCYVRVM